MTCMLEFASNISYRITDFAFKVFFETIEASGRSLLRFLHPPEADLGAPLGLRDFSHVLREIMEDYQRSLLGDETPEQEREGFKKILDTSLEPALEMCKRMGEMMPQAAGWEQHIFLINCFVYLQVRLTGRSGQTLQTDTSAGNAGPVSVHS